VGKKGSGKFYGLLGLTDLHQSVGLCLQPEAAQDNLQLPEQQYHAMFTYFCPPRKRNSLAM